jgi:hypothetical protein
MDIPIGGFIPIKKCNEDNIDLNQDRTRKYRGDIQNFSIRTILNKDKKNIINVDDEEDIDLIESI